MFRTTVLSLAAVLACSFPAVQAAPDPLASVRTLMAGYKYSAARPKLLAYLGKHPRDPQAELLLGEVQTRLGQAAAGAEAFGRAGTIPDHLKPVAIEAYTQLAVTALHANDNASVVEQSSRALALRPEVYSYYLRGAARVNLQQYAQAIPDLELARELGRSGKGEAPILAAVGGELVTAYLWTNQLEKATGLLAELRHSGQGERADQAASAYFNQRAIAASQASKWDVVAETLEGAARVLPAQAANFYVQAASAMTSARPVDWKRVKVDADLALKSDPKHARATYIAAIATFRLGDKDNGRELLTRAHSLAAGDAALLKDIDTALLDLR